LLEDQRLALGGDFFSEKTVGFSGGGGRRRRFVVARRFGGWQARELELELQGPACFAAGLEEGVEAEPVVAGPLGPLGLLLGRLRGLG